MNTTLRERMVPSEYVTFPNGVSQTAVRKDENASEFNSELPRMIPRVILVFHPDDLPTKVLALVTYSRPVLFPPINPFPKNWARFELMRPSAPS